MCVSWKHKQKWNHSSGGSGGSNWKIVNQALALACSCLPCMRAHLWLLLLLLFFVVIVVVVNSNQTIPLKLIKTFNTSPCLFSLFSFIELLNLLPLLFRSVVVWCFTLESKFCVYRETSALDANFSVFLNLLHRNVRFVLIFHPFCFSFGGFLSLCLSLKVPLLVCVCVWVLDSLSKHDRFFVLFHKRNNFVKWFFRVWFFLFLVFLEKNIHQNFGLSITDSV